MSRSTTPLGQLRYWFAKRLFSPLQGVTFGRWRRLRSDPELAVAPGYRARARLTSALSLMNSLQARRERRRFAETVAGTPVAAPVFVLGHYRSGTTHLHNLLATDPRLGFANYYQVSFPHSFLVSERVGSRLGAGLTMRTRPQDDVALGLREPAEDELALCADGFLSTHMCWHFPRVEQRFRRFLTFREATASEREAWKSSLLTLARKLTVRQGTRPLVFKSPCHTARVALLLETFPDARFVHIHRDPFTTFQSTRRMEVRVAPLFEFQPRDASGLDDFILWRFRETYDAFLADRPRIPDGRLSELSYEDLVRDPLGQLERVYDELALPDFGETRPALQRYLASIRGYRNNTYDELPADLQNRIAREWAPFLDTWGYGRGSRSVSLAVPR